MATDDHSFKSLVERCPDGVVALSKGNYLWVNTAFARLVGRDERSSVGTAFAQDVRVQDRERLAEWLSDRHTRTAWETVLGSGACVKLIPIDVVSFMGSRADVFMVRDLTEIQRAQAEELMRDRMAVVGALTAGLAHEINNPLSYVLGNLAFVREEIDAVAEALPAEQREEVTESLKEVVIGAERVREIIRQLGEVAGADRTTVRSVDMVHAAQTALNMAWVEIRHRARIEKDLKAVPSVRVNEATLTQVVLNLLLNTAQALPEGRATDFTIRVATRSEGRKVYLDVIDDGDAIPPQSMLRMFETFFTSGLPGVGSTLGLSIANTIVQKMGGVIEVASSEAGSRYSVVLPAVETTPAVEMPKVVIKKNRILVADDEPLVASALKRTLRGYDVSVVSNGREAIELLQSDETFAVILCDLIMPEVTGMEVYGWLEENQPGREESMVFLTGGVFTDKVEKFLESIDNPTLNKPFDLVELRELVASRIEQDDASA